MTDTRDRVFLAQQDEPVRREVALKVLRSAVTGREARARFEAERHAMGRLDHPNVGKILDAGTTDNPPSTIKEVLTALDEIISWSMATESRLGYFARGSRTMYAATSRFWRVSPTFDSKSSKRGVRRDPLYSDGPS